MWPVIGQFNDVDEQIDALYNWLCSQSRSIREK
jgi:hypothetical protein